MINLVKNNMSRRLIIFLSILFAHSLFILLPLPGMRYAPVLFMGVVLYFLKHTKFYWIKQFKSVNVYVGLFCMFLIITSLQVNSIDLSLYFNIKETYGYEYENNGTIYGISYAFVVMVSFLFVEYVVFINKFKDLIRTLFYISCFYLIINDLLIIVTGIQSSGSGYFLGNKFTVSYLHLFGAILYNLQSKYKIKRYTKALFLFFLIYSLLISILVECSTAVVGTFLIIVYLGLKNIFNRLLYNKIIYFLLLISSIAFAFLYMYILDFPIVKYIIVDVLGEDITLTGRTYIFDTLLKVIDVSPLWGFGVGNSYQLLSYLYNYPNAQNGFIDLFIEQGVMGFIGLILIFFTGISIQVARGRNYNLSALLMFVFVLIILSSIEITINKFFVGLLTLLIADDSCFPDVLKSHCKYHIPNKNYIYD